jgi:hypothetical protein
LDEGPKVVETGCELAAALTFLIDSGSELRGPRLLDAPGEEDRVPRSGRREEDERSTARLLRRWW